MAGRKITDEALEFLVNKIKSKQDNITGGSSTIVTNNLTTNRALISNDSGKVAVSNITSTELNYLDGATSNIQNQLDSKTLVTIKRW